MNANVWSLGWRSLWRDLRSGELRLLMVAVALAVTALSAVGFFANRLQSGLERDALQLLGGDVVVASDQPTPVPFVQQAQALGLQTSTSVAFPTMARASDAQGGATRLVALKAVLPGYPLRGNLRVANRLGEPGQGTRDVPAAGEVWVDPSLLDALSLKLGDQLMLGDSSLRIARLILAEPDRGASFASLAPRAMLNAADLPATHLIQPASRVTYRFATAGSATQTQRFEQWAQEQLKAHSVRGVRVESLQGGRPEMRQTLDRAEKFLNLVALLAALLSAVAVALSARGFAARHLDDCAMLRVLGLGQRKIAAAYAFEFIVAGMAASAMGVALGFALHYVFTSLLAGLMDVSLPPAGPAPALLGLGAGLTLLVAFGLPPVLQLAQVPPLRVIRRDLGGLKPASLAVLLLGLAGFAVLLLGASTDLTLAGIALGGFAASIGLFALASWLAVKLLRKSVNESTAPHWLVLATRQISARPAFAVVQVSALAVGLLALVLLVLLRTDLVDSWRKTTPADAPNRFVINIMPEQGPAFQQALRDAGVSKFDWFPMIRGRLVAINGRDIKPDDYPDERARRLVDREFNLSHSAALPEHNTVIGGQWLANEPDAASVEEGIAQTLKLKLGDRLRFDIGGVVKESRITSLRKLDWSSMRANFFVMFPADQMPDVPATYMSAFRAPDPGPDGRRIDNQLVRAFPNITSVDMSQTIAQVQAVLNQVIRAVEFLFAFTLAAGLVVLFAAVTATREDRAREYAIMRSVGASSTLLRRVQSVELLGVGLLAGFLAALLASAVGWALAHFVFEFNWSFSPWVPLLGTLAGAVLAWSAGWWGLRGVLSRPVVQTLRQATV